MVSLVSAQSTLCTLVNNIVQWQFKMYDNFLGCYGFWTYMYNIECLNLFCFWKSKKDFVHPFVKVCILSSWMDITLKNLVAKKELQGHLDAWDVIIFIVATKQYWNNFLLMFEMSKKLIGSGETYDVDDQVNELWQWDIIQGEIKLDNK